MARDRRAERDSGKRLLVLGAGPAQLGLLEAARERGLFVVAADRDPGAVGFALADRRAIVSNEDEPALERLARAEAVDGVIAPGIDWPVAIAARIAYRLGLPHAISPEAAVLATSKLRQRRRLAEAGVAQPRWQLVEEASEVELEPPVVVKAPDRQGQRGLSLVRSAEELAPAVAWAREASRGGTALVEELADGPEVTVAGLMSGGSLAASVVTDRVVAEPPAFGVALAHVWPADAESGVVVAAAERAAVALGVENGPVYVQLRVASAGPVVVELAARLGGGHDAELAYAATGLDLNGAALAAALGDDSLVRPVSAAAGGACARFLVPPEGELRAVDGVEAARRVDGVFAVRVYRVPGHRFGPFRTGADRAGAVQAVGADRAEALARADTAAAAIEFAVD
ncbi:MAG TPA: ATP-grasp domain-containing protein [Gaiellaceae bacterium]